ncbi:MAG: hypothetical protein RLY99_1068 [Pseudomonadota bacterium]
MWRLDYYFYAYTCIYVRPFLHSAKAASLGGSSLIAPISNNPLFLFNTLHKTRNSSSDK